MFYHIKERRLRELDKLGFLLFMIGGAGMDSPNRTVPVIMVLAGFAIMGIAALKENRPAQHRPK